MPTCKFCLKNAEVPVHYGATAYAHPDCYLTKGKQLKDLKFVQLTKFPFVSAKRYGVFEELIDLIEAGKKAKRGQA